VATELSILRQLSKVRHPRIAQVFDFLSLQQISKDDKEALYAVVMEYVPHTLEDFLRHRVTALTLDFAHQVMRQLLEALDFLHRCGIMHRDIKPSNILVDLRDDGATVDLKLIDFSISKVSSEHSVDVLNDLFTRGVLDLDSSRLTKNVTTRPYRAPEVALMTPYDSKIDLWGAGCILAELLLTR